MSDIEDTTKSHDDEEPVSKEKPGKVRGKDLLLEMGSAALASIGKVLHETYSTHRLDGEDRTTGQDD